MILGKLEVALGQQKSAQACTILIELPRLLHKSTFCKLQRWRKTFFRMIWVTSYMFLFILYDYQGDTPQFILLFCSLNVHSFMMFMGLGETMSFNCSHHWAYCLSLTWYMNVGPQGTALGIIPGLCGERPATNCLSYGTCLFIMILIGIKNWNMNIVP
jgi:hypothetical protein